MGAIQNSLRFAGWAIYFSNQTHFGAECLVRGAPLFLDRRKKAGSGTMAGSNLKWMGWVLAALLGVSILLLWIGENVWEQAARPH
jgi:hypothetical protein